MLEQMTVFSDSRRLVSHEYQFGHTSLLLQFIQMICGTARRNQTLSVAISSILPRPCDTYYSSNELTEMRQDLNEFLVSEIIEEKTIRVVI